jgi:hypothetical protein
MFKLIKRNHFAKNNLLKVKIFANQFFSVIKDLFNAKVTLIDSEKIQYYQYLK